MLIFGKGASPWTHKGKLITHEAAVKVLEKQRERDRKYPPKVSRMRGTDWGDLAVIQGLRRQVFG